MSSPPPPPPPSTGSSPPPPPPGGPPPPPPPTGSPSANSSIASANYFFGFVITFIVLLLLFVGCGIGSWRRFRPIGAAWEERFQEMESSRFSTRKRGRRRLVRPVLSELWTHPQVVLHPTPVDSSNKARWEGVQPIAAAFVWSRSSLSAYARRLNTATTRRASPTPGRDNDDSVRGVVATLRSYMLFRRPRCDHPPKPPPIVRPPPEAIQVAVMIAMPSPASSRSLAHGPRWVGHPSVEEYQIGVVRMPWPSGDGP
ncbi:hypothetical protein EV363DRAFT_663608 [Boletus edulis]|nr:hypothetical protein EV363DRAFT_663608 [Boletus edulis]